MKALIVPSLTISEAFFHNRVRPFRVRGVEIITTGYCIDARLNNQTGNKDTNAEMDNAEVKRRSAECGVPPRTERSRALIVIRIYLYAASPTLHIITSSTFHAYGTNSPKSTNTCTISYLCKNNTWQIRVNPMAMARQHINLRYFFNGRGRSATVCQSDPTLRSMKRMCD